MESEERKEGSGGGEKEGVGWQREYGRRRKLEEEKGTDNKREGGGGYQKREKGVDYKREEILLRKGWTGENEDNERIK